MSFRFERSSMLSVRNRMFVGSVASSRNRDPCRTAAQSPSAKTVLPTFGRLTTRCRLLARIDEAVDERTSRSASSSTAVIPAICHGRSGSSSTRTARRSVPDGEEAATSRLRSALRHVHVRTLLCASPPSEVTGAEPPTVLPRPVGRRAGVEAKGGSKLRAQIVPCR